MHWSPGRKIYAASSGYCFPDCRSPVTLPSSYHHAWELMNLCTWRERKTGSKLYVAHFFFYPSRLVYLRCLFFVLVPSPNAQFGDFFFCRVNIRWWLRGSTHVGGKIPFVIGCWQYAFEFWSENRYPVTILDGGSIYSMKSELQRPILAVFLPFFCHSNHIRQHFSLKLCTLARHWAADRSETLQQSFNRTFPPFPIFFSENLGLSDCIR